jgi:acetyl esterase/lipase
VRLHRCAVLLLALVLVGCDGPKRIELPTDTGTATAVFWAPRRHLAPAVLVIPGSAQPADHWAALALQFRRLGFGTLVLERNPDSSAGDELPAQVASAFTFLRQQKKVDAARIVLLGQEAGAPAALEFAAAEPMARLAVLVSPPAETRVALLRDYGARPLVLFGDDGEAPVLAALAAAAQGEVARRPAAGWQEEIVSLLKFRL